MITNLTADEALAAHLRSARTTTQAEVDRRTRIHDRDDYSAATRATAILAHSTASPAGH